MTILVTGGSGFIGRRLKLKQPDWIYVSSADYNLLDPDDTGRMFKDIGPTAVVHLAARVGGIKDNNSNQVEFFEHNVQMNINVVRSAYEAGVTRLLGAVSTCAFPDVVDEYPFTEESIFNGPCAETNFAYGYSKRLLHALILSYRKQYGVDYSTFSPSNVYGPDDHFDSDKSHFIPSLISKVSRLKEGSTLELWGTGKPLRQQLYVDDLCEIIPLLLDKHHGPEPLIVAPNENLSINEMATILISYLKIGLNVVYNNDLEGQYRKDGANNLLLETIGPYEFTSFKDGIVQTYNWYLPF